MRTLIRRPSLGLVLSIMALFLSLGGTTYAVSTISGRDIAAHSITQEQLSPPVWHHATLKNGWVYGGYNTYQAGYAKDANGIVHLRGSIANADSTPPGHPFTLAPGFRPLRQMYVITYAYGGATATVRIAPNGTVHVSGSEAYKYLGLDNITFPTN